MSSDDPLKPDLESNQLAALVFELASQLHAERSARIALQAALIRAGITTDIEIDEAANAPLTREETAAALARSMLKLMRVLRESDDPRAPTRHEAPDQEIWERKP